MNGTDKDDIRTDDIKAEDINVEIIDTEDDIEKNIADSVSAIADGDSDKGDTGRKKYSSKSRRVLTYAGRALATVGVTLVLLVAFLYGVMCMLVYGPSPKAADLFVMSVRETSAIGFLANLFYSEDEIEAIVARNSIKDTDEVTDKNLVVIKPDNDDANDGNDGNNGTDNKVQPDIEVVDVVGATYTGKLMIVKDPSRVFLGTVETFHRGNGQVVADMAKRYGAIAGINGGEFVDGTDTYTAMPVGLVMTDGEIRNGSEDLVYHVTGITKDNILVVGNMSGRQAKEMGLRDCVSINNSIGPFLIINGEAMDVSGVGGGLNPRTAIGQRADGSILLLTIDGRQASSIGASFADLVYIMQEYGAVNASTMDGGTSTQMYYNGEVINQPYSPYGPRRCPTAFLVK